MSWLIQICVSSDEGILITHSLEESVHAHHEKNTSFPKEGKMFRWVDMHILIS
jgi:hypothetical protein